MKLSELGEDDFIQTLKNRFPVRSPLVGIGDDCAIIPVGFGSNVAWLVTTDALIEGVHFLNATISFKDLGYKSVAVNLSDIAAMGGTPLYVLLSFGISETAAKIDLDPFLDGMQEAFEETNVSLIGGDTVRSPSHLFINLTVIGQQQMAKVKRRDGAQVGDYVCVDGSLGDSAAGLFLLLNHLAEESPPLVKAHQRPRVHIKEGLWLAEHSDVHAMMDISDGLATDLSRMLKASHCGGRIELSQIFLTDEFMQFCQKTEKDPYALSVSGGEEYCLLFTIAPAAFEAAKRDFQSRFGRPFWQIGEVTKENGIVYTLNGAKRNMDLHPFRHFS